jgi:flagellin-like hook-associated protein FlgL
VAQQVRGGQSAISRLARIFSEQPGKVQQSIQRIDSGKRVLRSSDDIGSVTQAASVSIKGRALRKGVENLTDGLRLTDTGVEAIGELYSASTQIYDYSSQVLTTNVTATQAKAIENEANAIIADYNRIVQGTTYNGVNLLAAANSTVAVSDGALTNRAVNVSFGELLPTGSTASNVTLTTSLGAASAVTWSSANRDAALAQIDAMRGYATRLQVGAVSVQNMQIVNEVSAKRLVNTDQAAELAELVRATIRQQSVQAIAGAGSNASRWLSTLMQTINKAKADEEKQKQEAPEPV